MKHIIILLMCIAQITFLMSCNRQPKQLQYAQTIDEHASAMEAAIYDNTNTIDSRNSTQLQEHWGLILDNINAYQAEDKLHPCNEPECQTAFRKVKTHLEVLKEKVKQAHHAATIDLNQLFPLN